MNNDDDDNLETIVANEKTFSSRVKRYVVNTTSSWLYWTPIMTATEYFSGMEMDEITATRLSAMGLALFVAHPYGIFRQYWAELWKTDATSSSAKKLIVDTSAHVCFQLPLYSTILYASGTSFREGITALITGLTIGAVGGRPFGYFQDKWRMLWGTRPTLDTER